MQTEFTSGTLKSFYDISNGIPTWSVVKNEYLLGTIDVTGQLIRYANPYELISNSDSLDVIFLMSKIEHQYTQSGSSYKQYRVSNTSSAFRSFLTKNKTPHELTEDRKALMIYLYCDSDLLQLGQDFQNELIQQEKN